MVGLAVLPVKAYESVIDRADVLFGELNEIVVLDKMCKVTNAGEEQVEQLQLQLKYICG
ncbi:MAG: hypothetical protein IJC98_02595 [Clostridia bacterium]|nr:hypothetical protein [Clostridia bacterium]